MYMLKEFLFALLKKVYMLIYKIKLIFIKTNRKYEGTRLM